MIYSKSVADIMSDFGKSLLTNRTTGVLLSAYGITIYYKLYSMIDTELLCGHRHSFDGPFFER